MPTSAKHVFGAAIARLSHYVALSCDRLGQETVNLMPPRQIAVTICLATIKQPPTQNRAPPSLDTPALGGPAADRQPRGLSFWPSGFDDAEKLLAAALELGLEGIVSKKRDQPYRSGKNVGWVKVKTAARDANRGWELFR